MSRLLEPATAEEIAEIVGVSPRLAVRGGGTKPGLSDPGAEEGVAILSTARLNGVVEYLPEEYTITAQAGTPLAALEVELRRHAQYLPFDPPCAASGATVGGAVATGLNGPGRVRYGGLRDFVLGVRFVDGRGRQVRGGGKVVKNAAGFDLAKLLVGSCGGLGVLTEVTFKVFPAPPATTTVCSRGGIDELLAAHRAALRSGQEIQAIRVEPELLSVRLGGRSSALAARRGALVAALGAECDVLEGAAETEHWQWPRLRSDAVTVRIPVDDVAADRLLPELARLESVRPKLLGGAQALVEAAAETIDVLDPLLRREGLAGQALGPGVVGRLGLGRPTALESRVAGVLDPRGVFCAPGLGSAL